MDIDTLITPPLSQSNHEWSQDILGHGGKEDTLGWYACAASSFAWLCNALGVTKHATPRSMNNFLKGIPGAFVDRNGNPGVLLNFEIAAKAVGLKAPDAERTRAPFGDPKLVTAADAALQKGLAAFHVDHNSDVPGGDKNGDHFIAVAAHVGASIAEDGTAIPEHYLCMDPAPGATCRLDAKSLQGTSAWNGKAKHFKVVSVIPVYKP